MSVESKARDLLATFEVDAEQPAYDFFLTLLTKHLHRTARHETQFRAIGHALERIAAKGSTEELQRMAADLQRVELGADIDAIRLIAAGAKELVKRDSTNRNLKPFQPAVTDAQIRKIASDPRYSTRQAQADKLGIALRTLQRRLQAMKNQG